MLVGVVLVLGSIAGVASIVQAADKTAPVYAARTALLPGQPLDPADLVPVEVVLGASSTKYLRPGDLPDVPLLITRTIAAGELVPIDAIGRSTSVDHAAVVVTVNHELAGAVVAGSVVEVWSAAPLAMNSYAAPVQLLAATPVLRVVASDEAGLFRGVSDGTAVEILVPRLLLPEVLAAVTGGAQLSLVPTTLPLAQPVPMGVPVLGADVLVPNAEDDDAVSAPAGEAR